MYPTAQPLLFFYKFETRMLYDFCLCCWGLSECCVISTYSTQTRSGSVPIISVKTDSVKTTRGDILVKTRYSGRRYHGSSCPYSHTGSSCTLIAAVSLWEHVKYLILSLSPGTPWWGMYCSTLFACTWQFARVSTTILPLHALAQNCPLCQINGSQTPLLFLH